MKGFMKRLAVGFDKFGASTVKPIANCHGRVAA
jgi:hypothetical protein